MKSFRSMVLISTDPVSLSRGAAEVFLNYSLKLPGLT